METGTQILAGFLFTLLSQQRFGQLDDIQRIVYLILVILAAILTVLLLQTRRAPSDSLPTPAQA